MSDRFMVFEIDESQYNMERQLAERIPEGWSIVAVLQGSAGWRFRVFAQAPHSPVQRDLADSGR